MTNYIPIDKLKTPILLIILGSMLFFECQNSKLIPTTKIDELRIETVVGRNILLSEICSDVSYIKLESNSLITIGGIDKAIFQKNRIYILDSKSMKIAVFNKSGDFIYQYTKLGRGPGEFSYISDFLVDSLTNNVEVLDNGNRKIIKLNEDGNFISERSNSIIVRNFCKFSPNIYVFNADNYLNPNLFKNESYNAILLDSCNTLISSYLPINELKFLTGPRENAFVKYGNGVNFAVSYDTHIYYVTAHGFKTKYKISFGKNTLPENLINSYNKIEESDTRALQLAFINIMNEANDNSYVTSIRNIFENNDIIFFQYSIFIPGEKDGTYTVIFNKQTKQINIGKPHNNIDFGLFGAPLALLGDTLITYIQPNILLNKIKSAETDLSIDKSNPRFIELKKLALSLQESDNPLIVKFLLKDF